MHDSWLDPRLKTEIKIKIKQNAIKYIIETWRNVNMDEVMCISDKLCVW